jgi:DNA repair photolyase
MIVVSASRRIDMVGTAPDTLRKILETELPPPLVHTLVLWTKSPGAVLALPGLLDTLCGYEQIFFHVTITGMGGTRLEPLSPPMGKSLAALDALVRLAGTPERVRVRFDPVVHLLLPGGREYTNLRHVGEVASACGRLGIPEVVTSWMERYPKVRKRLEGAGVIAGAVSESTVKADAAFMRERCDEAGVRLTGCCAPPLESSRCIDGELFNRLHPLGRKCSTAKARGQRPLCTCSTSRDIGWYTACVHGCLYCYANPAKTEDSAAPWPE